jgi:hypothetical protein
MEVTEQAEEQRTEDPPVSEVVPAAGPPSQVEQAARPDASPALNRAYLRLAYTFEFWIALIAIFTVWSQVGGQGHLDLIAWYIKLSCALALAWSAVRMTSAMVENTRAWNWTTVKWFLAVLALAILATGITFWYHLHEVPDEPDTDQNSATTVHNRVLDLNFQRFIIARDREHC